MRYRWREANGDVGYECQGEDCDYCGAPVLVQDPTWSEDREPAEGQCPACGATGLYPLRPGKVSDAKD